MSISTAATPHTALQKTPAVPAAPRSGARRRLRRTIATLVAACTAAILFSVGTAGSASASDLVISGESVWTYTGAYIEPSTGWIVYRYTGYGITALCYSNGACSYWNWR